MNISKNFHHQKGKHSLQQSFAQPIMTSAKSPVSRGSLLFSQMQMLTTRIKQMDTVQERLISDKFQRTASRQGTIVSSKPNDSIQVSSVSQLRGSSQPIQYVQQSCEHCQKKDQQLRQQQIRIKLITKQMQNCQKQSQYTNFQLDLLKEQNKNSHSKIHLDSYKLLLRKKLEKFMSQVILDKLSGINKSVTKLNKKIEKVEMNLEKQDNKHFPNQMSLSKISISNNKLKPDVDNQNGYSSMIQLNNSSRNPIQVKFENSKIKQLELNIKQKCKQVIELQKQLLLTKQKNIDIVTEYECCLQKLKEVNKNYEKGQSTNAQMLIKIKSLEQKLGTSEKQYKKINQRYLSIHKKQQQLNKQLDENRFKMINLEKSREKYEIMQKQMLLKTRQLESIKIQLKQEKDCCVNHLNIISQLKEKLNEIEFQLSLKQEETNTHSCSNTFSSKSKSINIDKQFKIFEDSNNRLKGQIRQLNEKLVVKSKELEITHANYKSQLIEKQRKLYELQLMLKQDFSKIRDSKDFTYRMSRQSDNSLMLSTTRMSKQIDFIISEGDIIIPETINVEEIFTTKDFSKIQLDTFYDQQQFVRKVSQYIDTIKRNPIRNKSKSRTSSQQFFKQRGSKDKVQISTLVQNIRIEINRILKQAPQLVKDQFFKLKNLLDKFNQQLNEIESHQSKLEQLKSLSNLLLNSLPKQITTKQLEEASKNLRNFLRLQIVG